MDKRRSSLHEMIELSSFVASKKKNILKLEKEIDFFEKINLPLKIEKTDSGYRLYSEDYTLATSFRLKERTTYLEGFNSYDGGYQTCRYDYYPEFYFVIKGKEVIVGENPEREKVIRSFTRTKGTKEYSLDSKIVENTVYPKRVISHYRRKCLPEKIILKLKRMMGDS
jgi:hypothetical protein